MWLPNIGEEEEGVGVVRRNLHPGDQEMGTPGACSPASGSSPRRSLSSSFPRRSRLARSPERVPEMVPALPLPSCSGDTLEPLAQEQVCRPGLAVAPSTERQACQMARLGLWAVHKAPIRFV